MQKLKVISEEILEKITPNSAERVKIKALAEKMQRKVALLCQEQGITAEVRVEGSVAKDTWLREEPEIDVFMCLPVNIPRKSLGEISLKIARKATEGQKQVERFAEHPYLESFINGVRLNIVPCYNVQRGKWLSATDRTPFHTDYMKKYLNEYLCGEVRLLKKFLKGVDAYGAEIKIGGLSGYLCELLIVHYKSFIETLRAFAGYAQRIIIDIEGYYAGKEKDLSRIFSDPLVVVDPVDEVRNVASAVRPQKLFTLVAAARAFLKTPDMSFFCPPNINPISRETLVSKLENRGSAVVFLPLGTIEIVPDVLWGQLYKTQRALRRLAELNDFKVIRMAVWSDEKTLSVFTFELEQRFLSGIKKHSGPPLKRGKESEDFLSKYTENVNVISGPYVEDGIWAVELQRRFTDFVEFLREKLKDGGRNIGVAELISAALRNRLEVLVNGEVQEIYRSNREFAKFLTGFLSGKPFWLEKA